MASDLQIEVAVPDSQNSLDAKPIPAADRVAKGRLIQLDFVRGIAILMVMSHHFLSWPTHLPFFEALEFPGRMFGWAGVDLFFVLSGFLVGGLLTGELFRTGSLRIGRFIKRRGFKIWPAYYVYLLFQVVTRHFPLSTFLVANLLHLQNYLGTSLEHTWTLAVEEHFYLMLPFLLVWIYASPARRVHAPRIFLSVCVLVLAIRTFMVLVMGSTHVASYTHTRIDSLIFGVFLSHLYYYHREAFDKLCQRRILLSSLVCIGIAFLSTVSAKSQLMLTIGFTINYLCFAALLLLMLGLKGKAIHNLPFRLIAMIGVYSYSIYLWHLAVRKPIYGLARFLPQNDSVRWIALYLAQYACAIALGVIMAKLIEWPFLRMRERVVPAA